MNTYTILYYENNILKNTKILTENICNCLYRFLEFCKKNNYNNVIVKNISIDIQEYIVDEFNDVVKRKLRHHNK